MSRMKFIGAAISRSCKDIYYLVSDERSIIARTIDSNAGLFAQRARGRIAEEYFRGKNTYAKCAGQYIENCHNLMRPSMFTAEDSGAAGNKPPQSLKRPQLKKSAFFFVCADFHLLKEQEQGTLLRQFLEYREKTQCMLLLSAPVLSLPRGYEYTVEVIDVPGPDEEDIKRQLYDYALERAEAQKEMIDAGAWKRIDGAVRDFKGLESSEIHDVLYEVTGRYGSFYGRSAAQRKAVCSDQFDGIVSFRQEKIAALKRESALKDPTVTMLTPGAAIAGLGRYKRWFLNRKEAFKDPDTARKMGREPIRGVLMTGLPGTGKTQGAKFTAQELQVPLVQLRMDNLLGGLVGDSEKNFKRCRKRIEALAPCVVLIDEIEKLFSVQNDNGGGSSEVKMNLFSTLLDWMQENKSGIFFYATCNSVKGLKPELLRDGRFSMRFYVYMPDYQELTQIICFHMKRVNDLSGGAVFANVKEISAKDGEILPKAAERFLTEITRYGREWNRNTFFTGANIETLINNVQYELHGGIAKSIDHYVDTMMFCAKSEFCQPYGETNLKDAVDFWLDALENTFTDAADHTGKDSAAPLSFQRFDRKNSVFRGAVSFDNEYDKYLYEVFSSEIRQRSEERGKDERHMLEQLSEKIDRMNAGNAKRAKR